MAMPPSLRPALLAAALLLAAGTRHLVSLALSNGDVEVDQAVLRTASDEPWPAGACGL